MNRIRIENVVAAIEDLGIAVALSMSFIGGSVIVIGIVIEVLARLK